MRDPDLQSPFARAWRIRNTDAAKAAHVESLGYPDAGIDQWLVNGGGFHPFWSWWSVAVVHLRDVPGVPPAYRRYQEAQYEFGIRSLNPSPVGRPAVPDIDLFEETGDAEKALPGFLDPPDAIVQFHGLTDEQAAELCELSVRAIVDGHASPDSDFRSWWEAAVPNTVKHLRGEPH